MHIRQAVPLGRSGRQDAGAVLTGNWESETAQRPGCPSTPTLLTATPVIERVPVFPVFFVQHIRGSGWAFSQESEQIGAEIVSAGKGLLTASASLWMSREKASLQAC